jgi:hypothetical protein
MKHLLISPETILLQRYKYEREFRVAGFLLFIAALLQLPLCALGVFLGSRFQEQSTIQSQNRVRTADLERENSTLRDVRQKLAQIRQWEPICNRGAIHIITCLSTVHYL